MGAAADGPDGGSHQGRSPRRAETAEVGRRIADTVLCFWWWWGQQQQRRPPEAEKAAAAAACAAPHAAAAHQGHNRRSCCRQGGGFARCDGAPPPAAPEEMVRLRSKRLLRCSLVLSLGTCVSCASLTTLFYSPSPLRGVGACDSLLQEQLLLPGARGSTSTSRRSTRRRATRRGRKAAPSARPLLQALARHRRHQTPPCRPFRRPLQLLRRHRRCRYASRRISPRRSSSSRCTTMTPCHLLLAPMRLRASRRLRRRLPPPPERMMLLPLSFDSELH